MIYFRSLLFNAYYFIVTFFISVSILLLCWMPHAFIGVLWGKLIYFGAKWLVGITVEFRGLENIPSGGKYIVASKHESAMETMLLYMLFPKMVYILKRELTFIPVFGQALWGMGCIPINRAGGAKTLKLMAKATLTKLEKNKPVVIFPEGTRRAPTDEPKYTSGVAFLYAQAKVPVVPVALNTGLFWSKKAFVKKAGKVVVSVLPPIQPGLNKTEFMKVLQDSIESECKKLI